MYWCTVSIEERVIVARVRYSQNSLISITYLYFFPILGKSIKPNLCKKEGPALLVTIWLFSLIFIRYSFELNICFYNLKLHTLNFISTLSVSSRHLNIKRRKNLLLWEKRFRIFFEIVLWGFPITVFLTAI